MSGAFSLLDIFCVGCGIYAFYSWYLMTQTGEVRKTLLLNAETDMKKCKDKEGYIRFIAPRLFFLGVAAILSGGISLLATYVLPIPMQVVAFFIFAFFFVVLWFGMQTKKSMEMFW